MRGGTSKGLYFHARDVPSARAPRDALLRRIMGSPDVLQIDGLGGSRPVTSKVAIIGPPSRPDADVDYTFAQVDIESDQVSYAGNCGNISSGVGPFAVDEELIPVTEGITKVRIHNTNTGKVLVAHVPVRDGFACVDGDFALPGVPGTAAEIVMDWSDTLGAKTGRLLPTGKPRQTLDLENGGQIEVSLVDAANPVVWVPAGARTEKMEYPLALVREIRGKACVLMGLCDDWRRADTDAPAFPMIGFVAPPQPYKTLNGARVDAGEMDLRLRLMFMNQLHPSVAGTGAINRAAASRIPGSVVAEVAVNHKTDQLLIGHPSGVMTVRVIAHRMDPEPFVAFDLLGMSRSARRLMQGATFVPVTERIS
jgi:2-methylaconitate cis-trans-isomerase PrpF